MGKRRKARKRWAAEASDRTDAGWALDQWQRRWGKPPAIVLIGMWMFHGPIAAILFGFSLYLVASLPDAGREGGGAVLACLLLAAGSGAFGYYIFWRPLWRTQCFYWSFERPVRDMDADEKPQPKVLPVQNASFLPDSRQYGEAIEACQVAIAARYSIRRVSDKELPRHAKMLERVVEPSMTGQVELLDAFEVTNPPHCLAYGVVAYRSRQRHGRSSSEETRCGQIVMLTLSCDLSRLWIRPEALADTLAGWIADEDLDFADHPQFSRRYFCASDNPDLIRLRVPDGVWQSIGGHDEILVLGRGPSLVVAKERGMAPEQAIELVDLAFEIMSAFADDPTPVR
jgi:hypothetical protein